MTWPIVSRNPMSIRAHPEEVKSSGQDIRAVKEVSPDVYNQITKSQPVSNQNTGRVKLPGGQISARGVSFVDAVANRIQARLNDSAAGMGGVQNNGAAPAPRPVNGFDPFSVNSLNQIDATMPKIYYDLHTETQKPGAGPQGLAVDSGTDPVGNEQTQRFRNAYVKRNCICKIDINGSVSRVAGIGISGYSGDGYQATIARLNNPGGATVGADGSLYIADTGNHCIRRVGQDGIITTVAGTGAAGYSGDGGAATEARLGAVKGLAVDGNGSLFIADADNECIRMVKPDGRITTIAGGGVAGYGGDEGTALGALFNTPSAIAVGPDGSVYVTDAMNNLIRKISYCLPGVESGEISIPAEDGSELYVFDKEGRHLRTVNASNGVLIYQFGYDSAGRLISVADGDGNITAIQRDDGGKPTGVLSASGNLTTLHLNDSGYLCGITCPLGKTTAMTYGNNGLLATITDHKGYVHEFTYDTFGRLVKDEDPAGGFTALAREEAADGYKVTAASALGKVSSYAMEYPPAGGARRINTGPTGAVTLVEEGADGVTTVTLPDGTVTSSVSTADLRWGMQAPLVSTAVTTPAGLRFSKTQTGAVTCDSAGKLAKLVYTNNVNGRLFTSTYDLAANTVTSATPLGMKTVTATDAKGHVMTEQVAGLDAVHYSYDGKGRLTSTSQGNQSVAYTYDAKDRVSTVTNAAGNITAYEYNDANLVTKMILANNNCYLYGYDANGQCTQITMPSGAVHTLDYNVNNQDAGYTPPASAAYTSVYNLDKAPTTLTLPSGRVVATGYDSGGRPASVAYDAATVAIAYSDATDRVTSITRTAGSGLAEKIEYAYDGSLLTQMTVSGTANGVYSYRYNNDFAITGMKLGSNAETTFSRNEDGLLTGYGPFTLDRSGPAGAVMSMSDSVMNVALSYDSMGRVLSRTQVVNAKQEYSLQVSYNNIGKIVHKLENIAGAAIDYTYSYDAVGQLTEVRKNGAVAEGYDYDVDGNRIARKLGTHAAETAAYDSQDRLTNLGGTAYTFDADGFLANRGGDVFTYSATGELLQASLTVGKVVSYSYDGTGRRVGRKLNSQIWQYLYGNLGEPFQLTATIEPGGTLTSYCYDDGGRLFAFERGGVMYYAAGDQVGTPKVITDAQGNVVKTLDYDSFGQLLNDSAPSFFLPISFAGGLADPDTGLVRFGFRDYDPAAGRWTAKDPIYFKGGQSNLYAYCGSDPVNFRDVIGLYDTISAFADILGGLGGYAKRENMSGYVYPDRMVRIFPNSVSAIIKPWSNLGKASTGLSLIAAGADIADTWQNNCKSIEKKIAKTAIIAGGVAAGYGTGAAASAIFAPITGPGSIAVGVTVSVAASVGISRVQDYLYKTFDL